MTHAFAGSLARPRTQIGLVVAGIALLAIWAFSQVFVPPASRTCMHLYRTARTAADTAQVDHTVPDRPEVRTPEARSCGSIRQMARWF